ncbi:potassium channel family protein [Halobacteriota archaeon]
METCEYVFHNKEKCVENVLKNSEFCILHIDLPEDEESEEFKKINESKKKKVEEKVSKEDFNFEGVKLLEIDFSGMKIKNDIDFNHSVIRKNALFIKATIGGDARFIKATIGGDARFIKATIGGDARFGGATIDGYARFGGATIGKSARFEGATIGKSARFEGATIGKSARFGRVRIGRNAWFKGAMICLDAWFKGAIIGGDAWFEGAKIGGNVRFEGATIGLNAGFKGAKICKDASFDRTKIGEKIEFKGTTFKNPEAQKNACRTAKNIWAKSGDREEEDYYHYHEMEAKRKQKYKEFSLKPFLKLIRKLRLEKLISNHIEFFEEKRSIYYGFLDLPIQYIFGYGIYPFRVIAAWGLTVLLFALYFWIFNGVGRVGNGVENAESFLENLYFSIFTATTLGYGDYRPNPGHQLMAGILAIFGTFMWAAFITIFARKYMR